MFLIAALIGLFVSFASTVKVSASAVNDYIVNNNIQPANETLSLGRIYNQDPNRNGGINMDFSGGKPKMIIIHEVGVDGGSINGSIDYMVRTQDSAFVHSFVDDSRLITIADKSKKSWGSGGWGNQYGIQIEQMRVTTSAAFYREIATLAKWTADQMITYGMGEPKLMSSPSSPEKNNLSQQPDGNLASHKMIAYKYNQTTDHVDPDAYWARFGYDMYQFRDLVAYYYNGFNLKGMTWQKISSDNSEVNFGIAYQSKSKLTFDWQYYDITNKTWHSIARNTGSNWVTAKLPHAGQYLIYVKATNAEGETRDYSIGWTVEQPLKITGMTWQKSTTDDSVTNFGVAYESDSNTNFDWQYYDLSTKKWTALAKNSPSNWVTFKAPHAGQYLIYVKATNANGVTQEYTIGWQVDLPLKLSGLTWQKLSEDNGNINFGVNYQSNSQVSFTWQYYELATQKWTIIADKTASNWVTFKAPRSGQYLIYVKATNLQGETKDYSIGWNVNERVDLLGLTWQKMTSDGSTTNFGVAYDANSQVTFTWQYYDIYRKTWVSIASNKSSNWVTATLPSVGQYLIHVEAKTPNGTTTNLSIGWEVAYDLNSLTGVNEIQKAWFNTIYPSAQRLAKENDLFPSIMMSQAIAESSWGQSELSTQANNLFGVKADATWKGASYKAWTNEVVNGQTIRIQADFRKYNSQAESLIDYVTKIKTTMNGSAYRYQGVWRSNAKTYENAARALQAGGYATDPNYPTNLINRIVKYRLNTLD